jgi:hypothetical protein
MVDAVTEYMVYYSRIVGEDGDKEIVMRCCMSAVDEDDAIIKVRNTLRGRFYNLHAEACKSCK